MGFRTIGIRLAGDAIGEQDTRGKPIVDDTFLLLLNAYHEDVPFVLPAHNKGVRWELVFDTSTNPEQTARRKTPLMKGGYPYALSSRGFALMRIR